MSETRPSVTIRMTGLLKEKLEEKAKARMRSLNAEIVHLLSLALVHGETMERWDNFWAQTAEIDFFDKKEDEPSIQRIQKAEEQLLEFWRTMNESERIILMAVAERFANKA